jgi:hypothetical protein
LASAARSDDPVEEILPPVDEEPPDPWTSFAPPTGDADRGYSATGYTPETEGTPYNGDWVPPFDDTGRREVNVGQGLGFGPPKVYEPVPVPPRDEALPLGWEDWGDPFYSPSPGHGMDPQLRDLLNQGPAATIHGLYPTTAPALGALNIAADVWADPSFRQAITRQWATVPPSMTEKIQPLAGTTIQRGGAFEGAAGAYYPDQRQIVANPGSLVHEFAHGVDLSQTPPASWDPSFRYATVTAPEVTQPGGFYQAWAPYYGWGYYTGIPAEVAAEEANRRLQRMLPTIESTDVPGRIVQDRIIGSPQQSGFNLYAPGSTARANYDRYMDYVRDFGPEPLQPIVPLPIYQGGG